MKKKCKSCKELKELKEFYKDKDSFKDGRTRDCRKCRIATSTKYREDNIKNSLTPTEARCHNCGSNDRVRKLKLINMYKFVCWRCTTLVTGRAYVENLEKLVKQNKESL